MPAVNGPVAVTGSTGHLGGLVARALADAGQRQRLLVRDLARAPQLSGAVAVQSAYGRPGAAAALADTTVLFMVSAAESVDRLEQHRAFIDAAVEAGVRHVVYTSFLGAAADCTFTLGRDHWATEQHIRASGLDFTFLRDNFYLDFLPDLVGEPDGGDPAGVIRGPAGDGRVGVVARADIAAVAGVVLADPAAHVGATYELTGPEALSFDEVAAILSERTGRPVRYLDETLEQAYASRAVYGAPGWQVDAWVSTYTAIAAGELARVTTTVRDLTGRNPQSLQAFLT